MFNTTRGALRSFFGEVIEKNYFCLDFKNATRKCAMTMLEPHRSITPRSRIAEIDFLKGVFIVLMIIFHLVYLGETYPLAKRLVYTFHMPGFLVISGFLMHVDRGGKAFGHTMLRFLVPYLVIESGYIVMASVLPIREHITKLTPGVFLDKLLLNPLGPYWYLHTLMLCGMGYFAVFRLRFCNLMSKLCLLALIYAGCAGAGLVSLPMSLYFLAGCALQQGLVAVDRSRCASPLSGVVLLPVVCRLWSDGANSTLSCSTPEGVLTVMMVVSFLLYLYKWVPAMIRRAVLYLGRNSLPLFIFSPLFTMPCNRFRPLVEVDSSGLLFGIVSVLFTIAGSLAVHRAFTWLKARVG